MAVYGYIRKQFPEETTIQISKLMSFGCQDLFIETADLTIDTEFQNLFNTLEKGDKLIVTSIVTFGKTVNELQKISNRLDLKKVRLICLKENIDTQKVYSFNDTLTVISSINKEITSMKVKQRLEELQDSGKQLGRPPINEEKITQIKYLRNEKQLTLREISDRSGVSLGTVYKYID